jgi:predicted nucleic acid-binding protein
MTFVLAQDACEAWFRSHRRLRPRITQNQGQLYLSALTVMPMTRWLLRLSTPASVRAGYNAFMGLITIVDVNEPIAHRAVMLDRLLQRQGHHLGVFALVAAATALERGFTLVTHDAGYQVVPGLTTQDWTLP